MRAPIGWSVRLREDRRGGVAAMLALALPKLAGFAAVAVDLGHARAVRAELQAAVDLTAIAACPTRPRRSPPPATTSPAMPRPPGTVS